MKSSFSILIFLMMAFVCRPLIAQGSILDTEVSIASQTASIKQILFTLENLGNFTFSYGKEVPVSRTVKISGEKQSIRKYLDEMFEGDSLSYIEKANKILIIPSTGKKQIPKQTVRGKVVDELSKTPLVGVNILLGSEGPVKGTITDIDGYFRFENVPVGRHEISCSSIGYKSREITNLVVSSGKESVIAVEMEESVFEIAEVKISSQSDPSEPINSQVSVSGRSFSAYEIENFPGSISDISRAAVSFPGVISPNDGQNHIVIRGNSPKGLQWRMEGIEIPNLNHFSDIGASGGGVNVVSNNMMANSDFLTSAFPAEYGNALSGVFDLRLRTGNNEKHEQTFQLGLMGTEVMLEGPIHRASNTTYIAQYRYSTLKILKELGAELESVPDFQDLSFKIYHPTKKAGVFSLFGIGGLSHETGYDGYEMNSDMFTAGISNNYTINPKTFIRSVIAISGRTYTWDSEKNIGTAEIPIDRTWKTDVLDYTLKGSVILNRKFNPRHTLKTGIIYEMAWDDSFMGWNSDTLYAWYKDPENPYYETQEYEHTYVDSKVSAGTLQAFGSWSYQVGESVSLNTGLHFIQFYLNNNYSVEPRLGIQWEVNPRHRLSAGFGIHSRKESMTLYTGRKYLPGGEYIQANMDLELSKSRHYVLGYNYRITNHLHLKTELYYQKLYDIPAYPFPPYFTTMNFDFGFEGNVLTNYGSGYNMGAELALEKTMSKGFHFMWNLSVFDSKYENMLGEMLNTKYNGRYASNGMIGKEFRIGKRNQNTFSIASRYILTGGMRYLPIDEEASAANGYTVKIWDHGFSEQYPYYGRIDVLFKFKRNSPKHSGEWSLDLMNILNRENVRYAYWDNGGSSIQYEYQNPFILNLTYRIQF